MGTLSALRKHKERYSTPKHVTNELGKHLWRKVGPKIKRGVHHAVSGGKALFRHYSGQKHGIQEGKVRTFHQNEVGQVIRNKTKLKFKHPKGMKFIKMITEPATLERYAQFQLLSGKGVQASLEFEVDYASDLQNLYTQASTFYMNESTFSPGVLNETPNGEMFQAPAMSTPQVFGTSAKLFLQYVEAKYTIVNYSGIRAKLVVYDLLSKVTQTVLLSAAAAWTNACKDVDLQQGWTSGSGTDTAFTQVQPTNIDSSPTEYKLFNMTWGLVRKRTYYMQPGGELEHTFAIEVNRILDMEYVTNYPQIRGITSTCLFVAQGDIVDDNLGLTFSGNSSSAGIGIGKSKFGGILKLKLVGRVASDKLRSKTLQIGGLNTTQTHGYGESQSITAEDQAGSAISAPTNFAD